MKRFFHFYIFFGWFIVSVSCVKAQDTLVFARWNKSEVTVNNRGGLGLTNFPAIEYPANSTKFAVRKFSFWITGKKGTDTFAVVDDVFSNKTTWAPGPMALTGSSRKHVLTSEWPGLLKVSVGDILFHKTNYKNPGYTVSNNIKQWPGSYGVNNFPSAIAAFADLNGNGIYEPENGDYPWIQGSETVYSMQSDSLQLSNIKQSQTDLDMSVQWFHVDNVDSVSDVIFFRNTLCNRGNSNYSDVRVSAVNDLYLGNPLDNYLSTRVKYHAMTGYNSSDSDDIYGKSCPVVSWGWLNTQLGSSVYIENSNDIVRGIPQKDKEYFFLSRGFWKTGKYVSYGSSGIDDTVASKFVFSANDPAFPGKTWDEGAFGNPSGRRTGLISTVGFELTAGSCIVRDGFVSIIANTKDFNKADSVIGIIRNYYNASDFTLGLKNNFTAKSGDVWPNPVSTFSMLNVPISNGYATISAASGKVVKQVYISDNQVFIDLKPGVYILKTPEFNKRFVVVQ